MNELNYRDRGFDARLEALAADSSLFDRAIEERTRAVLADVRARGDAALVELTARYDGAQLAPDQFAVTRAELLAAGLRADAPLRRAVAAAHVNIARFSRRALRRAWATRNAEGARVGEKYDAYGRVGIYVPGGTAPLISTALMTVTLAKVAGCPEIVVCTPCGRDGAIAPALLHALNVAGATEIYRLGGAQAVGAMAYGTATIRPVQKLFGPGNAYVVAAKRLVVGHVAIDLLPGPSEVLVLADATAPPAWVAADLLAQAEHGSGHERVWLVTPSAALLRAVRRELERQLPRRARRALIERALAAHGWLIQVRDLAQGIAVANMIAPEHCEIMTRQPARVAERIRTAGALFLGAWSPTVLGDYLAGPSHTLPTGGAAARFAGLTVDQFQRRTSIVRYTPVALRRSLDAIATFAALEGLDAHGHSAALRVASRPGRRHARAGRQP